jgi:hypothetical protein
MALIMLKTTVNANYGARAGLKAIYFFGDQQQRSSSLKFMQDPALGFLTRVLGGGGVKTNVRENGVVAKTDTRDDIKNLIFGLHQPAQA